MGGSAASPGGALLRTSRMFSMPKPLQDSHGAVQAALRGKSSESMTKSQPRMQSVTSPLTSRQNGDWGFKRAFPLKTTLKTSTPLIRLKNLDARENVTDFESAADHTLSLEKFQELRVAMSLPKKKADAASTIAQPPGDKSVFEESLDTTDAEGNSELRRWKFEGPWLANMTEGDFIRYLEKQVRPRRRQFRALLREKLAEDITARQNKIAMETGKTAPPVLTSSDITDAQFTEYLRALRNDRVVLYDIVAKFLDLAPLGRPVGIVQSLRPVAESPWGTSGPPRTHPSAGISYLRTSSFLENHPVYGPQGRRTPVTARVVSPRLSNSPPRLGVAGFVADPPTGDNMFNVRYAKGGRNNNPVFDGIKNLDITTYGGAKVYVDPATASVDSSGNIILELKEAGAEAQVIARENSGKATVYEDGPMKRDARLQEAQAADARLNTITSEILNSPPSA